MTNQQDFSLDINVVGSSVSLTVTGRITFHTPVGQFTTNRVDINWLPESVPVFTIDGALVLDTDTGDYVCRKLVIEGEDLLKAIYKLALAPSEVATVHSITEKLITSMSDQGEDTHVN